MSSDLRSNNRELCITVSPKFWYQLNFSQPNQAILQCKSNEVGLSLQAHLQKPKFDLRPANGPVQFGISMPRLDGRGAQLPLHYPKQTVCHRAGFRFWLLLYYWAICIYKRVGLSSSWVEPLLVHLFLVLNLLFHIAIHNSICRFLGCL